MSFIPITRIVYCDDPNCECVYTWERAEGDRPTDFENDKLPCGHKIGKIIFKAGYIREGDNAIDMLEYLINNHMIKYSAFRMIREKGGELKSGCSCSVPDSDLNEDELEDMDWE